MAHRDEQLTRLKAGAIATTVTTLLAAAIWGRPGLIGGVTFGAIATMLQLVAAQAMHRTGITPSVDRLGVYGLGVLLRMLGVASIWLLVTRRPALFAIWPSAMGYLGAVLPLLYVETRLSR